MRTTLCIHDDVLTVARILAKERRQSIGAVISDLVRRVLDPPMPAQDRHGLPLFPRRGNGVVTLEMVNEFLDEEP